MPESNPSSGNEQKLNCPACGGAMETVTFQDIQIDRCTACKGLWFDAMEKEHLDTLRGSKSIDVGQPAGGRPQPARINCPICHTQMILMTDHRHPNVHYYSCTVCFGLFFNAGEFREHNESAVFHFFHELFHRK